MFASVNIPKLNEELSIPEGMTARLVIALGYPKEQVVIDEVSEGANLSITEMTIRFITYLS